MKPQTALIWTNSAAHLDTKTTIYLDVPVIIHPGHAENDYAFRFHETFQDPGLLILRMPGQCGAQRLQHFLNGLMELRFGRILGANAVQYIVYIVRRRLEYGRRKRDGAHRVVLPDGSK